MLKEVPVIRRLPQTSVLLLLTSLLVPSAYAKAKAPAKAPPSKSPCRFSLDGAAQVAKAEEPGRFRLTIQRHEHL